MGKPLLHSYSYAVRESFVPVVIGGGIFRQPGVFFRYEISPYRVVQRSGSPPLSHLFATIFAAIGGVLTIVGLLSKPASKIVEKAFPVFAENVDVIDPQVIERAKAKSTIRHRHIENEFSQTSTLPTQNLIEEKTPFINEQAKDI